MITLSSTIRRGALLGGALFYASGCGSPNRANIDLRKQNQQLAGEVRHLKLEEQGALQVIKALRESKGTLPTLPPERLAKLYTTHGIQFGRLTGGADIDATKPGDEGVAVYVFPVDQYGQKLKAAGAFDIEAFDLAADPSQSLVGKWHLDVDQANAGWNSTLIEYTYGFVLPFQKTPNHPEITVKVTFFDELTQSPFDAQTVVRVTLPVQPPDTRR
jgi:hypothetical protein